MGSEGHTPGQGAIGRHDGFSENIALTAHTPTTLHFRTRKHRRIEWKRLKVGFTIFDDSAKCLIKAKPALGLF